MTADNGRVIYHSGYAAAARRMKIARMVVLVLLLLSLIFSFVFFRNEFSMERLRFFLRTLELAPHVGGAMGDTVYYNGGREGKVAMLDGALVSVYGENLTVTDHTSAALLSAYHGYRQAGLCAAGTYFLLYDEAGSGYTLYDPFEALESGEVSGRLSHAALAADGSFALCADGGESGYYSVVSVYGRDGSLKNRLSKYKYVADLALTSDGGELLTASLFAGSDGRLSSELQLLTVGEKTPTLEVTYPVPVRKVFFLEDGRFAALFADGLRFFDREGERAFVPLAGDGLLLAGGDERLAVVSADADTRVQTLFVYDAEGALAFTLNCPGRVEALAVDGTTVALLSQGQVLCAEGAEKSQSYPAPANAYSLLCLKGDFYTVCPEAIRRVGAGKEEKSA